MSVESLRASRGWYDLDRLGWRYSELGYGKDGEPDAGRKILINDTDQLGPQETCETSCSSSCRYR